MQLGCEQSAFEQLVANATNILRKPKEKTRVEHDPQMLLDGPGEPLPKRQGRQYDDSYDMVKPFMFLTTFAQSIQGRRQSVSSLFVRRSVYFAFFPSCRFDVQESSVPVQSGSPMNISVADTNEHTVPNSDEGNLGAHGTYSLEREASRIHRTPERRSPTGNLHSTTASQIAILSDTKEIIPNYPSSHKSFHPKIDINAAIESPIDTRNWARKRPRTSYALNHVYLQQQDDGRLSFPHHSLSHDDAQRSLPATQEKTSTDMEAVLIPVIVYGDLNGRWEEIGRCTKEEDLEQLFRTLEATYTHCYTSTDKGRGLLLSESYDLAVRGDHKVYITIVEEL